MSDVPIWLWGGIGGLLLGVIGLSILWPACSKDFQALLKRFVISMLVKLFLTGGGFWVAIKVLYLDPVPLVIGFSFGYVISMFLEVIPCIWKIRKCTNQTPGID